MRIASAFLLVLSSTALVACSSREDDGGPVTPGPTGETSADACSDARDNDGDGLVDCAEPACGVHAWCAGVDSGPRPMADAGTMPGVDSGLPPVASCSDPLDVVFVIDVSTSMADEVDAIRRGMDSIWNAARALTTNTRFGLVVFVDDVKTVNDCLAFGTLDELRAEFDRWRAFCSSNNQPNGSPYPNSDCAENSLDALSAAATTCPWRDGATRIAIHVTDDTFAERPAVLSGFGGFGGIPVQRTYAETVTALMTAQVRVGSFAAPGAGEYCGAGTSPDVGQGFHAPYMGTTAIPEATGGRVWSIRDVRAGTLDMAAAINELIADEYCTLY